MNTVKLKGRVMVLRRVEQERYFDRRLASSTIGYMATVVWSQGVLNADPIEIPVAEDVAVGDVVDVTLSFRRGEGA
jgi:predicted RNA methylase